MGKHCSSCRQAYPSFNDHVTCGHCHFAAGICRLDTLNPCQTCKSWSSRNWGKLRKSVWDARTKAASRGARHWTCTVSALETWLEHTSTSSGLLSVVGSIADSEIRNLGFIDNFINVGDGTVMVVEVSVHQGPVGVTSAILVTEQAPTMDIMVPAPQCATVLTCMPAPSLGPTLSASLLVQSTSVPTPLLVPGPVLPPGTRAPITMQGWLSRQSLASIMFSGALVHQRPCRVPAHLWPLQLGQYVCLITCSGPRHSSPPCKPNVKSLLGNAMIWRLKR